MTNEFRWIKFRMFIKSGAVLPLAPEMQFTGEKPWNPVTLDLYPRAGETNAANLYEDDTLTTAYQRGEFRNTPHRGCRRTTRTKPCAWRSARQREILPAR